jgi:hypothetical protein
VSGELGPPTELVFEPQAEKVIAMNKIKNLIKSSLFLGYKANNDLLMVKLP